MKDLPFDRLTEALNRVGGGWATPVAQKPDGAQARAGRVSHYRSSNGSRRAHIKVYLASTEDDDKEDIKQASPERLARLKERFEAITAHPEIAAVPILDMSLHEEALIVVMEQYTPLSQVFGAGTQLPDVRAANALRELNTNEEWLHFDICPKNVAIDNEGRCFYLDLESVYLIGAGGADISTPMLKVHRTPEELRARLHKEIQSGGVVSRDLAVEFQNYQLARLALEIHFDQSLVGHNPAHMRTQIPANVAQGEFPSCFDTFFADGTAPAPLVLATQLESVPSTSESAPSSAQSSVGDQA
tara:strand:- start:796 stop:1698 length:903 start_codon:yes stop_codon:yes gene_type:complete